jgi:CRISPR type I-E-associated protein CasB/Cse2
LGLARVLAHVKTNTAVRPMRAAGWQHFPGATGRAAAGDDQPRLAEARFRRLLEVDRGEKLVAAFARLITLLGGEVNVSELARDFLAWDHEAVRRRWAFDYYAAAIATPRSADTQQPEEEV